MTAKAAESRRVQPGNRGLRRQQVLASTADIDAAVASARASFNSGVWANTPPEERAAVLHRAADLLEERAPELAKLITSELGCPIWFSERAHVPNPIRHLRYYGTLAKDFAYDERRSDGTNTSLVTQVPVGVVAAITPWNGPLSTPSLKVAPALAAGCSVILKPPPETPLTAYNLADALSQAGLPDGVLNIVPADREEGAYLVSHPDVDKVAFTGSSAAGKKIMAACAERIARVTLELGGKSAAIILDDADVDTVVPALLPMAFMVNGQACIAQTRLLVPAPAKTSSLTRSPKPWLRSGSATRSTGHADRPHGEQTPAGARRRLHRHRTPGRRPGRCRRRAALPAF